jgi:nitroreductase
MTSSDLQHVVHDDVDYVLSTTRTVRLRLDFTRGVDRSLVEECLQVALQAPSGANRQDWRFIAIDDAGTKIRVAEIYRECFLGHYGAGDSPTDAGRLLPGGVADSARYLADNLHRAPVLVVPYRLAAAPGTRSQQASFWASILPAAWSFMLAARSRGLATAYTARGLDGEQDLAGVLGVDYPAATQAGVIAVAFPDRQDFRPARRLPLSDVLSWNLCA